jgi:hypothetical protein
MRHDLQSNPPLDVTTWPERGGKGLAGGRVEYRNDRVFIRPGKSPDTQVLFDSVLDEGRPPRHRFSKGDWANDVAAS